MAGARTATRTCQSGYEQASSKALIWGCCWCKGGRRARHPPLLASLMPICWLCGEPGAPPWLWVWLACRVGDSGTGEPPGPEKEWPEVLMKLMDRRLHEHSATGTFDIRILCSCNPRKPLSIPLSAA